MAKLLLIGDPHLKITRFELAKQFLNWVNNLILEVKPDAIVNLGDTFDSHAVVRSEITQEFKKHVQVATSQGIAYYYVLGNHDMYKPNDSRYHALQSFKGTYDKLFVVDDVLELDDVTFVPYQVDISTFPKITKPICIAHQTFIGADYGFTRPDAGVNADQISAEIIISGHIHTRQMFGKVIYPGTPYAQSVNDVDQNKGVMLFDTETYKYSFIDCPLPQWKSLTYDLSEYSADNVKNMIIESVDTANHWVAEITGPKVEYLAIRDSEELQELRKTVSLNFKPHFTDSEKKKVSIKSFSVANITEEYIDRVYAGSLDKDLLKKEAAKVYSQLSQLDSKLKM